MSYTDEQIDALLAKKQDIECAYNTCEMNELLANKLGLDAFKQQLADLLNLQKELANYRTLFQKDVDILSSTVSKQTAQNNLTKISINDEAQTRISEDALIRKTLATEISRATEEERRIYDVISMLAKPISNSYATYALAQADIANIPKNTMVHVTSDTTESNNGLYVYDGKTLTLVRGDALEQAKLLINTQSDVVKNLIDQVKLGLFKNNETLFFSIKELNYVQSLIDQIKLGLMKNIEVLSGVILRSDKDYDTLSNNNSKLLLGQQLANSAINSLDNKVDNSKDEYNDIYLGQQVANHAIAQLSVNLADKEKRLSDLYLGFLSLVRSINLIETSVSASTKQALLGTSNVYTFPQPKSLATINIVTATDPLPTSGLDPAFHGEVEIIVDGESCKLFAEMKVQGQSSAGFPKKNWSIDLYTDSSMAQSAYVKIGNNRANDNIVFKANYIDHLHIRHNFNLNLWQEIQNSRKGYPKWDIDNFYVGKSGADAVSTGATASPAQFPATCNINGAFYGIGSITYTKKRINYNISKNKPKEILIDFAGITPLDVMDATIIEVKCPSKPTSVTTDAMDRWRKFAQSSSDNIASNWSSYMDKQNIIDYYLFVDFFCGADVTTKNMMFYSWDAKIWRIGAYDLDMAYGLDFDGTTNRFYPTLDVLSYDSFWPKIRTAFKSDIEARYAELRKLGIFTLDHAYTEMSKLFSYYPTELLTAEYTKWNPPSLSNTTFPIMMDWIKQRLVFLDDKHSYKGT